jgi:hypothetical protein
VHCDRCRAEFLVAVSCKRLAELLKRIFEVDPLACPRCGAAMRIIAFILDGAVIAAILRHRRGPP